MIEITEIGYSVTCAKCNHEGKFVVEKNAHTLEECIESAERWGYRAINNKWECPNCTGNTQKLDEYFGC